MRLILTRRLIGPRPTRSSLRDLQLRDWLSRNAVLRLSLAVLVAAAGVIASAKSTDSEIGPAEQAPPVPALVAPADLATFPAGTTSVNLQWSSVADAFGYNFEVYSGDCGGTPFNGGSTPATSTGATVSGLTDGSRYHWQIQSVGVAGHPRSQVAEVSALRCLHT